MSIQPRPPADRRGPGRPHKGDRHVTSVRIPQEMWDRLSAESEQTGISRGDLAVHYIAQSWATPHLDPTPDLAQRLANRDAEGQLSMTA